MTICIATIADEKYVVMAADRTLTLSLEPMEFGHEHASKIYEIAPGLLLGTAGTPIYIPDMLQRLRKVKKPLDEKYVNKISEALSEVRKSRIEQEILRKFGWDYETYERYYSEGRLLEAHARRILEEIDSFHACIHLVTGCVLPDGRGSIHQIEDPGTVNCGDAMGFVATGSGEAYALQNLIRANYTSSTSLLEAIYQVFEAKKNAEQAVGVGRRTDMWVIVAPNENIRLSDKELGGLNAVYEKKMKNQDDALREILRETREWLPKSLNRYVD